MIKHESYKKYRNKIIELIRKSKQTNNMTVCSCHVTYVFQIESTLYSCLNVKQLLARSRREIWSLSDCNWSRTQNHLVPKGTLNHLTKLAKWLSVPLGTKLFWVRVQLQSLRNIRHIRFYYEIIYIVGTYGFPKNEHFIPLGAHTYVRVSAGKKF